jgi:response regulator NasT
MFTNDHDSGNARAAVAAGVTAYIVAGLQSDRIRPILDVAMARFQHEQALRQELADARLEINQLSASAQERRVIDRAKALLMERQKLSENDAYARLRKAAMDKNLKIVEVAQRMLDVADLLG